MKQIPLTQGKFAIVDDKDYALVSQYKWHARQGVSGIWYAKTVLKTDKGKQIQTDMHRLIMGCKHNDGKIIDHINHNGLDNRRCNLWICEHRQNCRNRKNQGKGYFWHIGQKRWVVNLNITCKSEQEAKQLVKYFRKEINFVYNR